MGAKSARMGRISAISERRILDAMARAIRHHSAEAARGRSPFEHETG
jgi:hypothetical protein